MGKQVFFLFAILAFVAANDTGCKNNYNLGSYGKCVPLGCCEANAQDSDESLCEGGGSTETCCFRDNVCGANNCLNVVGTWVSRYNYHGSYGEIDQGFSKLAAKGVNRVYFNIWADGNLYAQSNTASSNGVIMQDDRLDMAVSIAKSYGMEVYAWFEYGTQASYGQLNGFSSSAAQKGWLLCGDAGCSDYFAGGNYAYLNLINPEVVSFLAGISADLAKNYPQLDGIQFDDHFALPNEFYQVGGLSQSQKFGYTRDAMVAIRDAVKGARGSAQVSYAPSTLDFSINNHNVDWSQYLIDGVVQELAPQYYFTSYSSFKSTLDKDLSRVPRHQNGLVAGIRLSGSGADTPISDVDQMLSYSTQKNLRGVSFWFADDVISDSSYDPPSITSC
ncbi:uncharacterized protein LOC131891956 [Tigriopus californicus]|uniref:uncharacterized protein LOC131891956 n=1 Tax=Tigriopus californicus TaxID=6832 RepID=UPI0027DA41F2|nr:uncharacterized protein LOC131891956 [Tigriopus californicus]